MSHKPTKKPAGRPVKPIDWSQFEQLCALQCTQLEIANVLHIHPNTLSDRVLSNYGDDYSTTYKRFSDVGKCSLRRYQFVQSKTNTSMAIWLGKNWLGQRDHEIEQISPKQEDLDLKKNFYISQYEIQQLKKEVDDLKSKANQELQRSHASL